MYCARVLNPGSTTWSQAVPAFLVAAALLFVPGTVAGLLARLRPQSALVVGPVLSTSALAVTGIVAPKIGVQWGAATFAAGIVVLWAAAALVGFAEARWAPRWAWLRPAVAADRDGLPVVDGARKPDARQTGARSEGTHDGRTSGWVARLDSPGWATVAGVAFAFAVVAYSLVRISKTPEAFPQHPDTIFHLADAQWMVEHHDISSLTAAGYITPSGTGFYPAAFHGFTATISMLTGVPVVVATSVFVLAAAGLAWPLGCIALATTLFGRRTPVVLATGVTCVAFTGYPYFLMGFGVLWPNLFGETLLPSYLATFLALVGSRALVRDPLAPRFTAAAILLIGLPGLTLAHPNALMSFGVFALVILTGTALRMAWRLRRRPLPALGVLGGTILVLGLVLLGSKTVAPGGMLRTGAIGPELKVRAALNDLVFFAPRGASYLPVLTGIVVVGIIALLVRRRAPRWVLAAMVVMFGLYWVNVTIDSWTWRDLTWPWYNNAVRLQAVAILPTVMVAVAGLVAVVDLLAWPFRRRARAGARAGAGAGATLLSTVGGHRGLRPGHAGLRQRARRDHQPLLPPPGGELVGQQRRAAGTAHPGQAPARRRRGGGQPLERWHLPLRRQRSAPARPDGEGQRRRRPAAAVAAPGRGLHQPRRVRRGDPAAGQVGHHRGPSVLVGRRPPGRLRRHGPRRQLAGLDQGHQGRPVHALQADLLREVTRARLSRCGPGWSGTPSPS